MLIAATLTSVIAGITEPIEFTFLFVAPVLFLIHALLAATMSTIIYSLGVSGNMGGGLLEVAIQNWIPLFKYHSATYLAQIVVGLIFTAIYFFLFRYLILKLDVKTPGREDDEEQETKLYTKKISKKNKRPSKEK